MIAKPARFWLLCLLAFAGSCASGNTREQRLEARACTEATIAEWGADPNRFEGRPICVSGFFGRLEPFGETRFEFFATREEAAGRRAQFFLDLGIRWDVMLQVSLSRHAVEPAWVEGTFEHSPHCWPGPDGAVSEYACSPTYPMRLHNVLLRFADGTEYRHPDYVGLR